MHGASPSALPLAGGFRWLICGSAGAIEVTGPALLVQTNMPVPWVIRRSDAEGNVVVEDEVPPEEGQPAIGRL